MNRYCTAVILIIVILSLIAVIPPAVRAMDNVDKNTKNTCRTIDDASSQAYTYIYANGLDQHAVEMYRHNLDLCVDAIKDNPDNYGLMWRYARAASEYCECVQALRATYPGWKKIMQTWGLKGAQMATQAQAVEPGRVEAYYWRTCCTGKYTMADGIGSMLTAIRQGALPKTRQDIIKAYELDPAYLDWITTYAYFQFLTHLPSIPFMVKGTKASRFKEALTYYEQYH
ncbi:MAG: hypothetical protein U9P80_02820, partial [Thermodesulfobacteriota bacterium]|nr:hypothetical protein [Thermodesulfobacteriota bacterium]